MEGERRSVLLRLIDSVKFDDLSFLLTLWEPQPQRERYNDDEVDPEWMANVCSLFNSKTFRWMMQFWRSEMDRMLVLTEWQK